MRAVPLVFLALVVVGCGQGDAYHSSDVAASSPMAEMKSAAPMADQAKAKSAAGAQAQLASLKTVPAPRLIVRNADLTVRVSKIGEAERSVSQIARAEGGGVEASQSADLAGPSPNMDITLRVPVDRFEDTLTRLEGLGTRLSKTISSDDVTTQAVDMDARLKSLSVQEDAYRTILGGARRIPDVLEVQERLTSVRTEIEQIVAQRRDLGDQAARSKIVVSLTQALVPQAPAVEPDWASQTWGAATASLKGFGRAIASLGIWSFAMLPIWLPIGLAVLFAVRRTRKGIVA